MTQAFLRCVVIALLISVVGCFVYHRSQWRRNAYTTFIMNDISSSIDIAKTELPIDFFDAVKRSVKCTLALQRNGANRCRIDFDTTVGDMTYTSLKNTLPFTKEYLNQLCQALDIVTKEIILDLGNETLPETDQKGIGPQRTVRVFFPDMGAAVLARNDWKMNTAEALVPSCISTGNIQNDPLLDTDVLAVILCPLYSEADSVKRILDMCEQRGISSVTINPSLINADQGFGVRARNLQKNVLNTLSVAYKLKTLRLGALVKEYPGKYTLWVEDASSEGGYQWHANYDNEPANSEIEDIFELIEEAREEEESGKAARKKSIIQSVSKEVMGFFQGLQRL